MSTIKASCPTCGDVALEPHQVTLWVCPVSHYTFTCQTCRDAVTKNACPVAIGLLQGAHVPQIVAPPEAYEKHGGGVITRDEELAFHEAIADDLGVLFEALVMEVGK